MSNLKFQTTKNIFNPVNLVHNLLIHWPILIFFWKFLIQALALAIQKEIEEEAEADVEKDPIDPHVYFGGERWDASYLKQLMMC